MPRRRTVHWSKPEALGSILAQGIQRAVEFGSGCEINISVEPNRRSVVFEINNHDRFRISGAQEDVIAQTIRHASDKLTEPVQRRNDAKFSELNDRFLATLELCRELDSRPENE